MTRDEVMALEAGPYLNALIERHVFNESIRLPTKEDITCGDAWFQFPHYSFKIVDALRMMNHLCDAKGLYFQLHRAPHYFWAGFNKYPYLRLSVKAEADTAPLAICYAALLVEAKDD